MTLCRAKEGATSSSNNWRRRRIESRKNLEQMMNKRQKRILSTLEGIHDRIWYLERKRKLRKYQKSNRRIWEEVLIKHKESKSTRKGKKNIKKERVTRKIYSKEIIWVVKQEVWWKILEKIRTELEVIKR